jgi:hypothetical protein
MKIPSSSRFVVGLALAGSVGVGAALAATAAPGHPDTASTAGQRLDSTQDTTTGTTTSGHTTTRRVSAVSLAEASRIAALIGHGRVTESDQESTPTGLVYEITVVGADGAERRLTVDRGTGRVLANTLEDSPEAPEVADGTDSDSNPHNSDHDGNDQQSGHDDPSDD